MTWLDRAIDVLVKGPLPRRRVMRALLLGFGLATPGLVQLLPEHPSGWRVAAYMVGGFVGCVGGLIAVGEPNEPKP